MHRVLLLALIILTGCKADQIYFGLNPPKSNKTEVYSLDKRVAAPGETVQISGRGFGKGMKVEIGGRSFGLKVESSSSASFVMPDVPSEASIGALFTDSSANSAGYFALIVSSAESKIPLMDVDPLFICSDVTYQDPNGRIKNGSRICLKDFTRCERDGETSCVANPAFPSVDINAVKANARYLHSSSKIAGVDGTLQDCSDDGDMGCLVSGPLMAAAIKIGAQSKILLGQSIAGVTGLYTPNFPARLNVRSQDTVNNQAGLLRDCSADNDQDCVSTSLFPTIIKSDLSAGFIKSGVTIAGVQGTMPYLRSPALQMKLQRSDQLGLVVKPICCESTGSLIVRSLDSAVSWSPTNGMSYTLGSTVAAGHTIVAASAINAVTDGGLSPARLYFYKAWAFDADHSYSVDPSSESTLTLPGNTFSTFYYGEELWISRRSASTYPGFPEPSSNFSSSVWMTGSIPNQAVMMSPLRLIEPPFTADFDYRIQTNAGDGFHFSWGKDITEYESFEPLAGSSVGLSSKPSASGYGILLQTYSGGGNTPRVKLVRLSDNSDLASVDAPLKDNLNTDRHVKIEVTLNRVRVYLFGSTSPALDYTHGSNWIITKKFVTFGAGTGGEHTNHYLTQISLSTP
ncbi:MAG: hypothetical protein V4655_02350 [Bdellovibrionota bacterium]|nr:MAG: hypothetical protein EOP09_02130 [Pseudomonadota bacterium]